MTLDLTEGALQVLEILPIQRDSMLAIPAQAVSPGERAQFHAGTLRRVVYECYFEHMIWSALGNSRNNFLVHVVLLP
jgi:hypothetical protein